MLLIGAAGLRRRAPVAVFAIVMLACGAELLFLDEFIAANAAALVALYTLVAYAPRRLAAIGFVVALAGSVPFAALFDDASAADAFVTWLVVVVHLTLAAVLGDRMHARLRERAGLEERTRMLAAERDQQATIAAAAERARIARELHDVVAHSLSVVIAQADGGRYAAEQDPGAAVAALHTIAATAREAQAEMRRALGILGDAVGRSAAAPARRRRARRAGRAHARGRPRGRVDRGGAARVRSPGRRGDALPRRPGGAHQRAQARRPRGARRASRCAGSPSG